MTRPEQNRNSPEGSCVEEGGFQSEPGEVGRWAKEAARGKQEVVRKLPFTPPTLGRTDSWEKGMILPVSKKEEKVSFLWGKGGGRSGKGTMSFESELVAETSTFTITAALPLGPKHQDAFQVRVLVSVGPP